MQTIKSKKIDVTVVQVLTFLALLAFVVFALVPLLTQTVDAYQFNRDASRAEAMTRLIETHQPNGFEKPLDPYEIRTFIQRHDAALSFTPQSSKSGFFYLYEENRIVILKYEDAVCEETLTIDTRATPAELFQEGLVLLTYEGSFVTEAVAYIYHRTFRRQPLPDNFPFNQATTQASFISNLKAHVLDEDLNQVKEAVNQMLKYYDAENTLFVSNYVWHTQAKEGQDIKRIVFHPGIINIPIFVEYPFEHGSIVLDEVILPATVRTIESQAFSNQFSIGYLGLKGGRTVQTEVNALSGVHQVGWLVEDYEKDEPRFHIDALFEGRPLIIYDLETVRRTNSFDLSHLRRYFDSIDVEIVRISMDINPSVVSRSRVYIYTEEGYYGFVIPKEID